MSQSFLTNSSGQFLKTSSGAFIQQPLLPVQYQQVEYVYSSDDVSGSGSRANIQLSTASNTKYINWEITYSCESDGNDYALIGSMALTSETPWKLMPTVTGRGVIVASFDGQTGYAAIRAPKPAGQQNSLLYMYKSSELSLADGGSATVSVKLEYPTHLFCGSSQGGGFVGKIYSVTIRASSTATRTLIPCYEKGTMMAGFYDIAQDEFLSSLYLLPGPVI